jgi:isoleucyl-tRNA synthetase
MKYALLRVENRGLYLILNELVEQVKHTVPFFKDAVKLSDVIDGHLLLDSTYKSPFLKSDQEMFPLIPSEHVSSKQGTGLVHVAPALGQDDFKLGIKFSLPTNCIIDELGKYTNDDPVLQKNNLIGKQVLNEGTTEQIRSLLGESLIFENKYIHSYPYDWRTKKPCIIRSSMQWFIDTNKLKEESMEALKHIKIRPPNVSNSMVTTLASRPYWCISRQRAWGLPIPCLYDVDDKDKKRAYLSLELIEKVKSLIKKDGNVDFWWSNKYDQELTGLDGKKFAKSNDIFDIWFDSGSSFNSVLSKNSNADLYCEGVDQFSGWFQSSLLLSIALNKKAPYKTLLVHGFVVDENNRKMSKSVGNVIEPIQAIEGVRNKLPQSGLDVLRFWIAHEYYKQHIQIGSKILESFNKRVFEIRSILRFIVGNLNDFNENHLVNYESLLPIDKYILNKLNSINELVIQNYEDMHLNKSLGLIENFFLTQLSSFYIKSVKDRLYCEPANSLHRRSAQTAFYYILLNSVLMIGPIMPHLAEEAFHYSILNNSKNGKSLFRSQLTYENCNKEWSNPDIENLFKVLNVLREKYHELIMSQNSAMFDVNINCNDNLYNLLKSHLKAKSSNDYDWLTECFSCAELRINLQPTKMDLCNVNLNIDAINYSGHLEITKTNKQICNRCRKYNCQNDTKNKQLCNRCYELANTV